MSQKPKRKEKNPSQRSSQGRNKKKLVEIQSKIPQNSANPTMNQSIKNMSFLSPQLQKTLNAILNQMIDDGMNMSLQQSPFQSPHNLVKIIASSPSKLSKAKDRFLLKAQQRFHKQSATKGENLQSPLDKYESNNSRKSSSRQVYAGKFTPTSPRSQESRSTKNSPRNDMKSSSFSKSNKKAKPGRVQNSSKQRALAKIRSNASRDSSANINRNSNPRKSLQKSNHQIYDSSSSSIVNPFISSKLKKNEQKQEHEYEFDEDPLKGPLESDQNNVFSYVKIQNMESLRHKPAAEPKNFKQAKEAVKECKDEEKLRAKQGPKYAQAKVTTWKGQHAGSVSQIVKSGPSIRYNQDMSVSLSNQLDPRAMTALGAMNSLFGRKSSNKKQSQSLYTQNNNYLNISAAGINDSHTPSWRQQQDVKLNFNQQSRLQQSPPLRSYSVQLNQKSKNLKKSNLQQSMDSGLKISNSNSLISSFQRKPFPGGGGGAHPRMSKSGSCSGLMGGRNNLSNNNVSNIINSSTLPPGVGTVLTASVKKYNKKNARSLMNLFNSILSMLDPNFDETQVYRTIRILKQLCERSYVSEEQLQEIQQQFQSISPPPQNDKKHFEIYQFVSCVIRHFQQKLYEDYGERDMSHDQQYVQDQDVAEDQKYYESSSSSKQRYQYQTQNNNNSNRDGYLSDFTPRNTQYDLQVMQTNAGRVQPPSNQIQETIAKKYNIPTLSLPLNNNSLNTKSSGAVVANTKFVQQQEPQQLVDEQIKYHDDDILKYNSIPLTRSPSARAKLISDKQQQQQHQQSSVFSPSAAIVMNNSTIGGKKYQHQINSPLKQKKKQNINKAINIVMKQNIKSLKKFFNRIDKLTQQSVSRGIQQQSQQDQSRSFSIVDNCADYQSNDITRTPAKHGSTSSNRKYKSAIKSSALLMNSSNRKYHDDKRQMSMGKKRSVKSQKMNNSIGGGSKHNNHNNSISFNTSSFLSPGNSNGPISLLGGGGAIGSNSSFLKSGAKSRSSMQQSSTSQQQQSHFSIRQQQQHGQNSLIHNNDESNLNVSAAATIARHIANLSQAKKIPKKDPHRGPDTLIKNQVVLYPFAQTKDRKKQLVVKVKERPSSPTKRLINLKNARVQASKHLNRLGSAHSYNLCVMSKDREDQEQERQMQQYQTRSRYDSIVQQAAKTFASPTRNSRGMIGQDSSDSDLQRANPADELHYQADQDIPPEPQKRAPSATKAQPKKQLQHQSFKNSTPKALINPEQQNESKATPFEYSDSKATGSTPPSQKNPISSASGKKNLYSASSSHYLQSSSPKDKNLSQVQAAYVSFGDSEQVKSSASTKKGIEFDPNFESLNKNAVNKSKTSKKLARNSVAGTMTKSKTVMNNNTAKTIGKEFSKQLREGIMQDQKRKASPSPAMMVKNSRKIFGDTIKSKNYLSNSLQRDKERLERSCRFLLSKLAGKNDVSLNKSKN